jgi:hypothetical protein
MRTYYDIVLDDVSSSTLEPEANGLPNGSHSKGRWDTFRICMHAIRKVNGKTDGVSVIPYDLPFTFRMTRMCFSYGPHPFSTWHPLDRHMTCIQKPRMVMTHILIDYKVHHITVLTTTRRTCLEEKARRRPGEQ